jgi:hypothetical protein
MSIKYNLVIGDFHVLRDAGEGNVKDVVLIINFSIVGNLEHNGTTIVHAISDFVSVAPDDITAINKDTFVAFENLTKEMVEEWIYSAAGSKIDHKKQSIESELVGKTQLALLPAPWIPLNPPNPPEEPIVK